MRRVIVCLAVLVSSLMMAKKTAAACPITTTFGDNCDYQCHCAGNVPCDPVSGSCPNGCASGWGGEYCQRGNAAAGKSSSTSQSSYFGSYSPALALGGKASQTFASCSHTREESQPWWQVDLGKHYVLFAVKIWNLQEGDVTECRKTTEGTEYVGSISKTRGGYTCQAWASQTPHWHNYVGRVPAGSSNFCRMPYGATGIEPWCFTTDIDKRFDYCYIPKCRAKLRNFKVFLDDDTCYHYTGSAGLGGNGGGDIRCKDPIVGRKLKIQLMDSNTALALCEVNLKAFQYRVCNNNHYGPNCNNRCQCANDVTCDDKTGKCPTGLCNDRFTGPYCNIEIPTVLASPASISVQWPYIRPHDGAQGAVTISKYYVVYKQLRTTFKDGDILEFPASKGMMNASLTGLLPSTVYSIGLQLEYLFNGSLFRSSHGHMTTLPTDSCEDYLATPVITVEANAIDMDLPPPFRAFLTTRTEVPGMLTACIKWLDIYFKATRGTSFRRIRKTRSNYTISSLTPFMAYDVIPSVVSLGGKVRNGTSIKITTAEDIPLPPSIRKTGASPTSISVTVVPPNPAYGVITHYILEMSEQWAGGRKEVINLGPSDLTYTFSELDFTTYSFRARAFTSKRAGAWSTPISIITEESIPGPPNTLQVTEHTTSSLQLIWTQPNYQSGNLKDYRVTCIPLFSYNEEVDRNRAVYSVAFYPAPSVKKLKITGLTPATEYNCSVAAQTSKGYGPSVWLRIWTQPERPRISSFPDKLWIVVGLVIGVMVILATVIISVVVTVERRRRKETMKIYQQPIPMNATPQNEGVYDELDASNDQATYYNMPPANNQSLYENIVTGVKKGVQGNVAAVVRDEDNENPCFADEAVCENTDL